jgi:hypothetical protein
MRKLFAAIFVLLALALTYGWVERAHFASKILSENAGMEITVSDLSLFPLTLRGIHVNDALTKTDVTVGTVILETPLFGLLRNPIVIQKLTLKDTVLKSDIDPFEMLKFSSLLKIGGKSKPAPPSQGKQLQIDKLQIVNLYVEVPHPLADDGDTIRIKVPEFSLDHLHDLSMGQLLKQIVHQAKKK